MEQEQQQLRNLRDFLLVYNRMTEICFQRCTSNLNYRTLTMDEERCVDSCAGKLIRSNHRLMGTYVQLMPGIVQRRMQEMEAKAAEMGLSAEEAVSTATAASPDAAAAESSPAFAPPPAGLVGEMAPVIEPPTGGVTDFTPAPPAGGATLDVPPIWEPPPVMEPAQIPQILSPPPGETGRESASLSETLRSLPDLTATPPVPPSPPGNGLSNHEPPPQPPSQ
ncbi:mitochondrial import inner membrane translocase subunit Tim10 B isoform X3 [Conger conger]|uniref:mitochondrial import inner membrane translocase subunit Tim10 B isoform X3 n=1 Tax=Conger conger TaxID=82655 RepID=UPI002A5AFE58|nr:mitochondrial import inner membrane translocase subunit Tim10 B isoform X3 [Conger conger]